MTPSLFPKTSLLDCFRNGLAASPAGLCVHAEDGAFTYSQIAAQAVSAATTLTGLQDTAPVVGVFAGRESGMFVGMLACLVWGKGYVPISPEFPDKRISDVISGATVQTIITTNACLDQLLAVLNSTGVEFTVLVLGDRSFADRRQSGPVIGIDVSDTSVGSDAMLPRPNVDPDDIAYLMFTSGSTGAPKGVPITHDNALAFVEVMQNRYNLGPQDRAICLPDFFFDLSIYPIWVTWDGGGAVFLPSAKDKMMPIRYCQHHEITVWCSVPSAITFLNNFKMLKEDILPLIRISVFCGEPLLKPDTRAWISACPNSVVDNLYGPTEVTVFSTLLPVNDTTLQLGDGDVISIGKPLDGVYARIVDNDLNPVDQGITGELCLAGPQVSPGYWNNENLTAEKFVVLPSDDDKDELRWYRTGDLAVMESDGNMLFKGRADDQVQVSGYRVELGDIEQAARATTGVDMAAAVFAREPRAKSDAIFLFATGDPDIEQAIHDRIVDSLPSYMTPKRIVLIAEMPMNSNNKIDKVALKNKVSNGLSND